MSKQQWLRGLPAVSDILETPDLITLRQRHPHASVIDWVRRAVESCRSDVLNGRREGLDDWLPLIIERIHEERDRELGTAIQPVINATGILLHTNLGRAPLADRAIERVVTAAGASNVELNLFTGKRNHRGEQVVRLLRRLTGCEDAVVVNNCAAATMMVLQTIAAGREVVVSRGQLVEIGGGFRLPDVFRAAGVILREVGTTNRTYTSDYEAAIGDQSGAVIRVHHSNFHMAGFVTEPSIAELVAMRRPQDLPIIDDLGSGWIGDLTELELKEPSVRDSVRSGADLTLFSGDKLLGGPQCGIILGRTQWISRLRRSPLMRAMRVDKLTLAALEATLEIHLEGNAAGEIPVLAMLSTSAQQVHQRCQQVYERLGKPSAIEIVSCQSQIGGGSVPGSVLPSHALKLNTRHPDRLASWLRHGSPAVQARIHDDALLLDLRTVPDHQCVPLADRLHTLLQQEPSEDLGR